VNGQQKMMSFAPRPVTISAPVDTTSDRGNAEASCPNVDVEAADKSIVATTDDKLIVCLAAMTIKESTGELQTDDSKDAATLAGFTGPGRQNGYVQTDSEALNCSKPDDVDKVNVVTLSCPPVKLATHDTKLTHNDDDTDDVQLKSTGVDERRRNDAVKTENDNHTVNTDEHLAANLEILDITLTERGLSTRPQDGGQPSKMMRTSPREADPASVPPTSNLTEIPPGVQFNIIEPLQEYQTHPVHPMNAAMANKMYYQTAESQYMPGNYMTLQNPAQQQPSRYVMPSFVTNHSAPFQENGNIRGLYARPACRFAPDPIAENGLCISSYVPKLSQPMSVPYPSFPIDYPFTDGHAPTFHCGLSRPTAQRISTPQQSLTNAALDDLPILPIEVVEKLAPVAPGFIDSDPGVIIQRNNDADLDSSITAMARTVWPETSTYRPPIDIAPQPPYFNTYTTNIYREDCQAPAVQVVSPTSPSPNQHQHILNDMPFIINQVESPPSRHESVGSPASCLSNRKSQISPTASDISSHSVGTARSYSDYCDNPGTVRSSGRSSSGSYYDGGSPALTTDGREGSREPSPNGYRTIQISPASSNPSIIGDESLQPDLIYDDVSISSVPSNVMRSSPCGKCIVIVLSSYRTIVLSSR